MSNARSYRKIVGSTAVFGSAQLMGVLINLLRGKLVALSLHSAGMGIMTLLTKAANTIQQFSMLGINVAAVRNISQVNDGASEELLDQTIRLVRRMFLVAAIFGLMLTVVCSPAISQASFGSFDYLPMLLLLSLSVFITILGTGEITVMQGLRRYKQLAFCSIIPPLCGLLISVPIYYFWGIDGIVPAMILAGVIYYLGMRRFSYHHAQPSVRKSSFSLRALWKEGHDIIQIGMVMTIGSMVGAVTTYSLMAFISNVGSVSDVGFYQGANVIAIQYVSMVFTAMATDYYPHLSAEYKENGTKAHQLVNQQTEVVLLSITPLAMLMILTAPLLISLLLTDEFQPIRPLICYLALANIFKALCFPMDYIAYAKGDKKYLFWIEIVWGNLKTLCVIAGCYLLFGLIGLGYGALASAVIDVIVSIVLTRWRYGFMFSKSVIRLLAIMQLLALGCFAGAWIENSWLSYGVMITTTFTCIIYSLLMLNRRMNLLATLKHLRRRS